MRTLCAQCVRVSYSHDEAKASHFVSVKYLIVFRENYPHTIGL